MKRLYRSSRNRMVSGVLGGVAEYFAIDATVVRMLFVLGLFVSVFTLSFVYLAAIFIMPDEGDIR